MQGDGGVGAHADGDLAKFIVIKKERFKIISNVLFI
jgi:hypothetical protein